MHVDIAALYRQLDPLRPLEADEDALYVELHPDDDVKSRLVRSFVRNASPDRTIFRLLTGHRGSGKTTELNRVRRALETGQAGKKVFVSTLYAQQWLDVDDLKAEDAVLQIVRQLVADLDAAGFGTAGKRFGEFMRSLVEKARNVRFESANWLVFSFTLKDYPSEREQFRSLLRGQLPRIFDLVNSDLLPAARSFLRDERGYDDILLIVDDLDKIPRRVVEGERVTNHEQLFLHDAAILRAVSCSALITIPIDLAYSPAQGQLRNEYGYEIAGVPLVTVADRHGKPVKSGESALIDVIGRRAGKAFGTDAGAPSECADALFEDHDLLLRVVRLSGGHLRSLLVLLTELLDRVDELPLHRDTVERYVPRAALNLARALYPADRDILRTVAASHEAIEEARFFDLVRNHYLFAYEAELDRYWYGLNPLLQEIEL